MAPTPKRRRLTPRSAAEWGAVAPQWLGILALVAQFIVWLLTLFVDGRGVVAPALLTAFGGLIVAGQGIESLNALRSPQRRADDPEPDEEARDTR